MFRGMAQVAEQLAMWLRQQLLCSGFRFGIRFFPLIFWLAWFIGRSTLAAGIGPVEFEGADIQCLCDVFQHIFLWDTIVCLILCHAVGMVRLIGDGGISFYIKDFAVVPTCQSMGVG